MAYRILDITAVEPRGWRGDGGLVCNVGWGWGSPVNLHTKKPLITLSVGEISVAPQRIRSLITPAEAERAIYLDYEGNMDRPPTLVGWMVDGALQGAIVEPGFATCAGRWRVKHIGVCHHAERISRLINLAQEENRLIVSWSEHDHRIMSNALDSTCRERLDQVYRNAIPTARRWHWYTSSTRAVNGSLAYFLDVMGYPVPTMYGPNVVGDGLRLIRKQLEEGRGYQALTPKAREGWRAVVKHNMHDLQGMEWVTTVASNAMSAMHPG